MNQLDVYKTAAHILGSKQYSPAEFESLSLVYSYLHQAIDALEKEKKKKEELVPEESPADEGIRA
jgi:hypothetical protein